MDTPPYPEMLLAAGARTGRAGATVAQPGTAGTHAESGAEPPGSLASGRDRQPAKRPGGSIYGAGGGTTDWPRTADRSTGWRDGYAAISGNAFGCGGTNRQPKA